VPVLDYRSPQPKRPFNFGLLVRVLLGILGCVAAYLAFIGAAGALSGEFSRIFGVIIAVIGMAAVIPAFCIALFGPSSDDP
jgi:hypothetical protein